MVSLITKKIITLVHNGDEPVVTNKSVPKVDPFWDEANVVKIFKYMYTDGTYHKCDDAIFDIVLKFEMIKYIDACCVNWDFDTFVKYFKRAIELKSGCLSPFETIFKQRYIKEENVKNPLFVSLITMMPSDFFMTLLSSATCDEELKYAMAESYIEVNSENNATINKLFDSIDLSLLSHKTLLHRVSKNKYIGQFAYYQALEKNCHNALEHTCLNAVKEKHQFCVGKFNKKYDGYTLVTNLSDVKLKFAEEYKKNKGIISIDDMNAGYLCTNDSYVKCSGFFLTHDSYAVKKDGFITFRTCNYTDDEILARIESITDSMEHFSKYHFSHDVGLFVSID